MLIYRAFVRVRHLYKHHIFPRRAHQKTMCFLPPFLAPHFLTFWSSLASKFLILRPQWRPAWAQMAPRITQMASEIRNVSETFVSSWVNSGRLASRITFGALPGTLLVDVGQILALFWHHLVIEQRCFDDALNGSLLLWDFCIFRKCHGSLLLWNFCIFRKCRSYPGRADDST